MDKPQIPVPKPQAGPWVLNETITDVSSSFAKAIFGRYKKTTGTILLTAAGWVVFWILLSWGDFLNPFVGFMALGLPAVGFAIYMYYVYANTLSEFYAQFAAANGFQYSKKGWLPGVAGALFNLGHSKSMQNIITGGFDGNHLDMFTYSYTVGSGKSQTTYRCTVAQIEYPEILPAILLVVDSQYFGGIVPLFSRWEKLKPAAAFDKNYDLYCKREFEIEALQIFTPDFMEKILTEWPQFNLEFYDNMVYVFCGHTITSKHELEKMYRLIQYLITKIEPVSIRMKSSLSAMEAIYR